MAYEWAKLGVRVVCVYSDPAPGRWLSRAPVVGGEYTLTALAGFGNNANEPCARFEDDNGMEINGGGRVWISRFRPLISTTSKAQTKQRIKLFQSWIDNADATLCPTNSEVRID